MDLRTAEMKRMGKMERGMDDRWRDNEGLLDAKRVILAKLQENGPLSHKYKIKHVLLRERARKRERETEHDKPSPLFTQKTSMCQ